MRNQLSKKIMAGLGVLAMLGGALLVFAPAAAASHEPGTPDPYGVYGSQGSNVNLKCADLDDGTEHGEPSLDFGVQDDVAGADYTTRVVEGEPLHIDWTSPSAVGFVLVKQSNYSAVFDVAGTTAGTVYVALPDGATASDQGLSHVTFCTGDEPEEEEEESADLTIAKEVDGPAPESWSFTFDGGDLGTFDLTNSAPSSDDSFHDIVPGTYTIVETGGTDGATFDGVDCGEATTEAAEGDGIAVVLADGDDVTCTFTNVFEEEIQPEEEEEESEVLNETVTPTPTPQPAATNTPAPEVLDNTVATLPQTGSGTGILAAFGAILLGFGSLLVRRSRHTLLVQD